MTIIRLCVLVLCVLVLCACARNTPHAHAPAPTTTGAEPSANHEPSPAASLTWHIVDDVGEMERYVIIGNAPAPGSEGRLLDGSDAQLHLHEVAGGVPPLTLIGYDGVCTPTRARRVVIVRVIDPEEPDETAFDAVAVSSDCTPVVAVEGLHLDARLVPLEIPDTELGEPIVATGEAWRVRLRYGPSEDGICPGSPLHVEVHRNDAPVLSRDFPITLSYVRIVTVGERAWLMLGENESAVLIELGSDREHHFSWPSGVDFAQIC